MTPSTSASCRSSARRPPTTASAPPTWHGPPSPASPSTSRARWSRPSCSWSPSPRWIWVTTTRRSSGAPPSSPWSCSASEWQPEPSASANRTNATPRTTARNQRGVTTRPIRSAGWAVSDPALLVSRLGRKIILTLQGRSMAAINRDDVAHLARLAHIEMSAEELDRMAGELAVIVDSVKSVSEAAGDDVPATSHPIPLTNVFREDVVGHTFTAEQALSGAPDAYEGRFKVPAILDED